MKVEASSVQQAGPDVTRLNANAPRLSTAQADGATVQRAESKPSEEQVQRTVRAPERAPTADTSRARISVDEASNRLIAQVVDENNEVIKQYPPEAILQFTARFRKLQGLLFDEQA